MRLPVYTNQPPPPNRNDRDYGLPPDEDDNPFRLPSRKPSSSGDLSGMDWLLCILCPGIGCIMGIVYLSQGRPNGGKMIGLSILFAVLWNIVRFGLISGTAHR
jgi:hypothetical protein